MPTKSPGGVRRSAVKQRPQAATIDGYIRSFPPDVRRILEEIRRVVPARVPDAEESVGYRMPAFRRGTIFFYFAAFKRHIGVFPPVKGDAALRKALLPYRGERGNLRFPLDQPIPYELIGRVAAALAREQAK